MKSTPSRPVGRLLGALCVFWATVIPVSLFAHPHVFIDTSITIVGKNSVPATIRVEWRFDQIYSQTIFDDFSKPSSGVYVGKELADLKDGAFDNLKEYGFFAKIKVDGKVRPIAAIADFSARIDAGGVVYGFSIPVAGLSLSSKVSVSFFDESFFVSFGRLEKKKVQIEGLPKETKLVFGVQNLKSDGFGPMQVDEVSLVPGVK